MKVQYTNSLWIDQTFQVLTKTITQQQAQTTKENFAKFKIAKFRVLEYVWENYSADKMRRNYRLNKAKLTQDGREKMTKKNN